MKESKLDPFSKYPILKDKLILLENQKNEHFKLYELSCSANHNNIYITDFFIKIVLKRSLDLLDSFILLIKHWHHNISGSLLRMQIDNLIRIDYLSYRSDELFTKEFLRGKSFRELKHTDGKRITDQLLIDLCKKRYPWLQKIYTETSKFIHLSSKNYYSTIININEKDRTVSEYFSIGSPNWPEDSLIEFLDAFYTITNAILEIVKKWIDYKENLMNSTD